MAETTSDAERDEYLNNECTPWGDGCFKFLYEGVPGVFRREPDYSGHPWAIAMISEKQDWASSSRPKCFPLNCEGSYRYLIKPSAFNFDEEQFCITRDLLAPWNTVGHNTKWINHKTRKGTLRQAYTRHSTFRNIKRYISYYTDSQHRPISNVLYQYVVEPHNESPKRKNNFKAEAQKRRSAPVQVPETSFETKRTAVKRRRTEMAVAPRIQQTPASTSRRTPRTPLQRRVKEEKPMPLSPPISEDSKIDVKVKQEHVDPMDPVLIDLHNAYNELQKIIQETKARYCTLANPREMTATNEKLIKLMCLQRDLDIEIGKVTEHMKTMTEEILTAPTPRPAFQPPMPVNDDSDIDVIQGRVNVKIEVIEID